MIYLSIMDAKAFPLRRRWPEGPDEVATNRKLSRPVPSSVACGDSFPPRGSP